MLLRVPFVALLSFILIGCSSTHGPYELFKPTLNKVKTYEAKKVSPHLKQDATWLEAKAFYDGTQTPLQYDLFDAADQLIPYHYKDNKSKDFRVSLNYKNAPLEQRYYQGLESTFVQHIEWWLINDVQRKIESGEIKVPDVDLRKSSGISGKPEVKFEDTFESYEHYKKLFQAEIMRLHKLEPERSEYQKIPNLNNGHGFHVVEGEHEKRRAEILNEHGARMLFGTLQQCFPRTFGYLYSRNWPMQEFFKQYTRPTAECVVMLSVHFPTINTGKRNRYARNFKPDEIQHIHLGQMPKMSPAFWAHLLSEDLFPDSKRVNYEGVFSTLREPSGKRILFVRSDDSTFMQGYQFLSHHFFYEMTGLNYYQATRNSWVVNQQQSINHIYHNYRFKKEGGFLASPKLLGACMPSSLKTEIAMPNARFTPYYCDSTYEQRVDGFWARTPINARVDAIDFRPGLYLKTKDYSIDDHQMMFLMNMGKNVRISTTDNAVGVNAIDKYDDPRMNAGEIVTSIEDWVDEKVFELNPNTFIAYVDMIDGVPMGVVRYFGLKITYDLTLLRESVAEAKGPQGGEGWYYKLQDWLIEQKERD